jgi:uncharacterized protein
MQQKKVRVLSIDGGGIRGIIPATVLAYVERQLAENTKNPNARIADYFDIIVGTSTGGILSCFYLVPHPEKKETNPSSKYTAKQAKEFYIDKGYHIFNKSKLNSWMGLRQLFNADKYSPKNLENIFLTEFGDLKMSELLKPCVVTTYDLINKRSFFFSSKESKSKNREFYVRDALRSTSAAPTYFPAAKIKNLLTEQDMVNIDGGVFANNPTMCAYAECCDSRFPQVNKPGARDLLILSIGTGGGNFYLPDVRIKKKWGVISWAKSIPDIMMSGSLDTVDYQMKKLYGTLEDEHRTNYLRIDVSFKNRNYSNDMADASKKNINALIAAGNETLQAAIEERYNGLNKFIDRLIENAP